MQKAKGKVWKFSDNINTDEIIPARYLNTSDPEELAKHCMEDANREFPEKHSHGDIIIGGKNFGSGSSREHAPVAIKASGISAVIADSFARIFFRNCINIGLPIIELNGISQKINEGDEIEIDFDKGIVKNLTTGEEFTTQPFPPFMQEIINAGGLMNKYKNMY